MPRKQNGFGAHQSFAFKQADKGTHKSKKPGAAGYYPSDRSFGSSVHRTVIEKYNLDSDWVKWRKGFEYYNKAAWYKLQTLDEFSGEYKDSQINSVLYQGTDYEVDVVFDGYKFATKGADSNNHYVMKRTTTSSLDIGTITEVYNDAFEYPERKRNREIWVKGTGGTQARALLRMIGERITDGETEATLDFVLTSEGIPALYIGKSTDENPTTVKVQVKKADLVGAEPLTNPQDLVGKIMYVKDFFIEKPLLDLSQFETEDNSYTAIVDVTDGGTSDIEILDSDATALPPSLYDISQLDKLYTASSGIYEVKGSYIFDKTIYQRFFGNQYLSAALIGESVDTISYSVFPFKILGVTDLGDTLEFVSVPFKSEFRLTLPPGPDGAILVFTDYSFIKRGIQVIKNDTWEVIDTDIDPWMDEVFTTGLPLQPATVYTCSCPSHSHSILRAPQETQDDATRKINRQRRYPLPTVLSSNDYQALGMNQAAGLIESWESRQHKMSFKTCKHSIAAMFIEKVKIKEPSTYPTVEAREQFEEKLAKDMEEVGQEFVSSYKRGGLTTLEVIFALAQGLNLDDVETAFVMLNSNF